MNQILILIFSAFTFLPNSTIGQDKISVPIKKYIYNNFKDTIKFTKLDVGYFPFFDSLKIIDSIQIDGQGSKEIIFYRICKGQIEEHGGTFDVSEKKEIGKYEIWNLDTKICLFEAVNYMRSDFKRFRVYEQSEGNEFYKYDLIIDSVGKITLKNFKTKVQATTLKQKSSKKNGIFKMRKVPYYYVLKPDNEEGDYKFINGKYSKYN